MNIQFFPKLRSFTPIKHQAELRPEQVELFPLQEQYSGLLPLSYERPVAEILAERLAEADPASMSPVFIP